MVIIALLVTGYTFGLYYKVGDTECAVLSTSRSTRVPRHRLWSRAEKGRVDMQMTIQSGVRYGMPVLVVIGLFMAALIYFSRHK
jgi:hypothetical protein